MAPNMHKRVLMPGRSNSEESQAQNQLLNGGEGPQAPLKEVCNQQPLLLQAVLLFSLSLCRLWAAAGRSQDGSQGSGMRAEYYPSFPQEAWESPYLENRITVGPVFLPQSLRLG